jgi:hypothetical protein
MKKLIIILGALVAVILIAAAIAPKDFTIERSVVINKPRLEVLEKKFPHKTLTREGFVREFFF